MQQAERDKICRYCLDNASLIDLVNEGIIIPESVRSKWEFEKLIRGCLGEGQFKCPVSGCEEQFETAADLRGHTRVHISAKVLVCKICRKRFVGFCILYPEPQGVKKDVELNVEPSVEPKVELSVEPKVEPNDEQIAQPSEETVEEGVQQDGQQNVQQDDQQNEDATDQKNEEQNTEETVEPVDDINIELSVQEDGEKNDWKSDKREGAQEPEAEE